MGGYEGLRRRARKTADRRKRAYGIEPPPEVSGLLTRAQDLGTTSPRSSLAAAPLRRLAHCTWIDERGRSHINE